MPEPTLQQIFGSNATQDATTITLNKSDLGITASSATGEAILAGVILKAEAYLTQANFDANTDQSIYISDGFSSFTTRGTNNTSYRVDQRTINLAKIDSGATLDPNNY